MATFKIDPAHSDISFSARHLVVTTVRGRFTAFEGTLEVDEERPENTRGEIRIDAASLTTGVEFRDQHLRSADFFDVENHPSITFRPTSIVARGGERFDVTGDVTILGTSRPVTFDVSFLGFYSAMTGARRIGLSGTARINRTDWGLNWNKAIESGGMLVSEEIRLGIEIAAEEAVVAAEDTRELAIAS